MAGSKGERGDRDRRESPALARGDRRRRRQPAELAAGRGVGRERRDRLGRRHRDGCGGGGLRAGGGPLWRAGPGGGAGATSERAPVFVAGLAGLVAGALSMGTGEYVSVNAQRDSEQAMLALEAQELEKMPETEFRELV